MNIEGIREKIIDIAARVLEQDKSKIAPESHLVNDLGADSLYMVELTMEIEKEFGCDIPDEDSAKISTIEEAAQYILEHQTKKSS